MELTKREHFAILVFQGLLAGGHSGRYSVADAVIYADALIKELDRVKG